MRVFISVLFILMIPSYSIATSRFKYYNLDGLEYTLIPQSDSCYLSRIDTLYFINKKEKKLVVPDIIEVDSVKYRITSCQSLQRISWFDSVILPKHVCFATFNFSKFKLIDMTKCGSRVWLSMLNCEDLVRVKLSNVINRIPPYAFKNCKSLREINLPDSLSYLTLTSFDGCESLTELYVPKNLRKIETAHQSEMMQEHQMGNVSFISIHVDKRNKFYSSKNGVLYNKDKTELVLYPGKREDSVFVVPKSVKKIGAFAFFKAKNLKRVYLSDSIYHIGRGAFSGCTALDSIRFPNRLVFIDKQSMPDNMKHIYFRSEVSFDRDNPASTLHFSDGRVVPSMDFFNHRPKGMSLGKTLTCDSVKNLVKSITDIPRFHWLGKYGIGGDSISWRIVKYGKSIVPCLISMMEDTSTITATEYILSPKTKEIPVNIVASYILVQIIPELGPKLYSMGLYDCLNNKEEYKVIDFLSEWYDQNKDNLVWVHTFEKCWLKDTDQVPLPSGGYYELYKKRELP